MRWNSNHLDFLSNNYCNLSRIDLCEKFNEKFGTDVSVNQITSTLKRNKINSGRNGRYEKGYKPWHSGTSGEKGATGGTFKKGVKFKSHAIAGDELNKNGIIYIKMDDGSLKPKHNYLYEKCHNIKINTKKQRVIFVDGNRDNYEIKNLLLVSRSQLAAVIRRGLSLKTDEISISEKLIAIIDFHEKTNPPTGGNRGMGDE